MKTPAWDIESEYPSLESKPFKVDESFVIEAMNSLEKKIATIDFEKPSMALVEPLQSVMVTSIKARMILWNLSTYLGCRLSVDAGEGEARKKSSELETLSSRYGQIFAPVTLFLQRCDQAIFDAVHEHPELKSWEIQHRRSRELAPFLLSAKEEILIRALETSGHHAWGNLRNDLVGTAKVELRYPDRVETVGLSEAAALVYGDDAVARKVAWTAIQGFWNTHRETGASIVNALAGWRHEVYKKRSHTKARHFLDDPLYDSKITRETLDAMIEACRTRLPELRRAPLLMAKTMGQAKMEPWDLLGPSPIRGNTKPRDFEEGLRLVKDGFASVDPSMGEFVQMMSDKRWIEARSLPTKAAGAHCTYFPKSRSPRVFQTYIGSLADVMTLAHELGHAFHAWVMRDLSLGEQDTPMTLAETASVFAENVLGDALLKSAKSKEEKIEFGWNDLEGITGFCLNIPVRYEFEKNFYEKRQRSVVTADELNELMDQAWTTWYGPTVTQNDKLFWAHKMHFAFSQISFYNFPYTFGYLFSLSLYARREQYGAKFMKMYTDLLMDTGRMTAEDLIRKHLDEDIRRPEFWMKALDICSAKIKRYEQLLGE